MSVHKALHVLKFGSSVLTCASDIPNAVAEIESFCSKGKNVFVIVSALGDTTDDLIATSNSYNSAFNQFLNEKAFASVLATGENTTAALLNLALIQANIKSKALTNEYLLTSGGILESEPNSLNQIQIKNCFKECSVVIAPGFLGVNKTGDCTSLGRGGSDLSAVYSAWALNADSCSLIKDVNGVYNKDPNKFSSQAKLFSKLTFDDANKISGKLIQKRALNFAQKNNYQFNVRSLACKIGTEVGANKTSYANKSNITHNLANNIISNDELTASKIANYA